MRHAMIVLAAASLLSACQTAAPPASRTPAPAPPRTPAALQLAANIDAYKALVAQQIMAANGAYTFSGRLPPMLPAIVVSRVAASAAVVSSERSSADAAAMLL